MKVMAVAPMAWEDIFSCHLEAFGKRGMRGLIEDMSEERKPGETTKDQKIEISKSKEREGERLMSIP